MAESFFTITPCSRHCQRSFGKINRDNHRQKFRRESDRERDGKKKRFKKIMLQNRVREKDKQDQGKSEFHYQRTELFDASVKLSRFFFFDQGFGDAAEFCVFSCRLNSHKRFAGINAAAHIN